MTSLIFGWVTIAVSLIALITFILMPSDYPKTNTVLFLVFTLGFSFGILALIG